MAYMPIIGKCKFKECDSLCCRQLRLFYPNGTFIKPVNNPEISFLFPESEYNMSKRMSNGEYVKLLGWRGIVISPRASGILKLTVPTLQEWKTVKRLDHTVLILPNVPCRYLRKDGSCKIHNRKPAICKDFPRGELEINESCSFSWIETPTGDKINKELIT